MSALAWWSTVWLATWTTLAIALLLNPEAKLHRINGPASAAGDHIASAVGRSGGPRRSAPFPTSTEDAASTSTRSRGRQCLLFGDEARDPGSTDHLPHHTGVITRPGNYLKRWMGAHQIPQQVERQDPIEIEIGDQDQWRHHGYHAGQQTKRDDRSQPP